ncbi:M23 family metallopeptidase [Paenibacillus segetis]|uniref:Metalloendopeptidase n=1 Tax=Paenibacillus segetis TaxID=1325360 RepID=A0ABQ1YMZ4_9BACL|nr:M23 family metallopeptidase [Paenibacillus segetis]GGH30094.1 metalloendopeptidase [Paenibacillus segetis]
MKGFRGKVEQLWRGKWSRAREKDSHSGEVHGLTGQDTEVAVHSAMRLKLKSKVVVIGAIATVVISGTLFFAGKQYVQANTVSYLRVYADGQEIGTIDSENSLKALYERKETQYKEQYPQADIVVEHNGIKTVPERSYKAEVNTDETLDKLDSLVQVHAKAVELRIDGKVIGLLKDEAAVTAVLNELKGKYTPETTTKVADKMKRTGGVQATSAKTKGSSVTLESVKFNEEISQASLKAEPNQVIDPQEALDIILQGSEKAISYEVREGDTISSIAQRFGIAQKELFSNNPNVKERSLQIGTELKIKAVKPALTVKTVERVSEEIVTEPQVIVRKSSDMQAGKTKVISEGQSGLKTMEYRLTKENGVVVAEEWLGQEVSVESKPKIVLKGTKILGEGTGDFAWPVASATMSSSYGKRWGRMHEGVDLVSSKRNIMASDEGVVTFAGTKSGYGNCIIINHKNGYETLYGHLSKISVKKGQVVEKGSVIGIMGNTGRSTGTHLHFEIIKNGSVQNPMKYL